MANEWLKLIRKSLGMTQQQLAQRLGIGKAALSMIETGKADRAETKPVNYIHIPNLPKCDGAIYVVGDSMYPLLKSGDIVLYKQLSDIADIFWGDMYLLSIDIDGEEYITVKYIQKSDREGFVKLVSQNPHLADMEVAMSRIRRALLCAPEFVCDRAYSNTSSGASGRYGPSFASKITAGSNTVRLCHCPAGISTP